MQILLRFEVYTTVSMKRRNVSTPYSGYKNSRTVNQREQVAADVLPKCRLTQYLHGAPSKKTAFLNPDITSAAILLMYTVKCIDIWSSCLTTRKELCSWDQFSLYSVVYFNGTAQNIVFTLLSASLHRTQLKLGWSESFWCTLIGLSLREFLAISLSAERLHERRAQAKGHDPSISLSLFQLTRKEIIYINFHNFFNLCGHAVHAGEIVKLIE